MEEQNEARPQWLMDGLKRLEETKDIPFVRDRVTIDVWDYHPQSNPDDFQVVICLDGEVVGKPLSQQDGCAVVNWLQDAFPQIEKEILDEVERLYEEDDEKQGRFAK